MNKIRKVLFLMACVLIVTAGALAQAREPVEINEEIVAQIAGAGLLGFGVIALTQIGKGLLVKWFKLSEVGKNVAGYVVSFILSGCGTAYYFSSVTHNLTLGNFIGYTIAVFAFANGWFKFRKQTS